MANETKIGLLVGMAFIVCFAVLLSHRGSGDFVEGRVAYQVLSKHGQGEPARATTIPNVFVRRSASMAGRSPGGLGFGGGRSRVDGARIAAGDDTLSSMGRVDRSAWPTAESAGGAGFGQPGSVPARTLDSSGSTELPIVRWEHLFGGGAVSSGSEDRAVSGAEGQAAAGWDAEPGARDARTEDVDERKQREEAVRSGAGGGNRRAGVATYVVQAHDTLWKIAGKVYGRASSRRVKELFELNQHVLKSPDDLRPGMELRVPSADGGRSDPDSAVDDARRTAIRGVQRGPDREGGRRYYVVRRGDRYASIAERLLGDRSRWQELYELNRDIFPDPGKIQYGVRIRIPGDGPQEQNASGRRTRRTS